MKKLLVVAWAIFIVSLILKIFSFPTSIFAILGCLLIFIHGIIYLIKNVKTNLASALLILSFSFWTIYLLFRIQYWYTPRLFTVPIVFIIPFATTIVWFIIHFKNKIPFRLPQIMLIIYFMFCNVLGYIHSYSIFYFFKLNTITHNESRKTDYHAWDEYSWFLYISNRQNEALDANHNAKKIVDEYLRLHGNDAEAIQYSLIIEQHETQIRQRNWNSYNKSER